MLKKKLKSTLFKSFFEIISNFFDKFNKKNFKNIKVSKINFSIILLISIIALYLLYLSLPAFYKHKVHYILSQDLNKILNQNLSLPKNIRYSIIPRPHFYYKDVKIIDNNSSTVNFAEFKNLKIFISQKNFFDRSKIIIKSVFMDQGNIYFDRNNLKKKDFIFYNKIISNISIKNSNIFFKNFDKELIALLNLEEVDLNYNKKINQNQIYLKGKIFNTPIKISSNVNYLLKKNETNILFKDLKLKIKNLSEYNKNYSSINKISTFRTELNSNIKIYNNEMLIKSNDSNIQLTPIKYSAQIELNPFFFSTEIDLEKINIKKLIYPILLEDLIKNFIMNNEVINGKIFFKIKNIKKNKLFKNLLLNLNFNSGKIELTNSIFKVKKIGDLNVVSNSFSLEDNRLIFSGKLKIDIKNDKNFYKRFMVSKKDRFKLNKLEIDMGYSFAENIFYINKIIFNDDLNNSVDLKFEEIQNWAKFKQIIQKAVYYYSG